MDSFGFEIDLRSQSLGQANCLMGFSEWQIMTGDPLDKELQIPVLEPCQPMVLPRDIMIKTRRRKGLKDDIPLIKFFDDDLAISALKKEYI